MIPSSQNNLSLLDLITIISFIIGVANYEENVDQSTVQNVVKQAVTEIHNHLEMQDIKIDKILEVLDIDSR